MTQTPGEVAQGSALRSVIATMTGFLVRWAVTKLPQLQAVEPQLQEFIADMAGIIVGAVVKFFTAKATAKSVSVVP